MTYLEDYQNAPLVLPRIILENFQKIFESSQDFLVWLYFYENRDAAPSDIAKKVGTTLAKVNKSLKNLELQGNLKMTMVDMEAVFDPMPVFSKLDLLSNQDSGGKATPGDVISSLAQAFEAELGLLSPIHLEEIRAWIEEDQYDPDLIREALKEAVLNRKLSLNYIKAILRNWKNEGVKTLADVRERRSDREEDLEKLPSFHIPTEGPWKKA